jgi:biotin transport system substrate-specific component
VLIEKIDRRHSRVRFPAMSAYDSAATPRAVIADVIPGARTRDAALVIGGALLTALFAQISINVPGSPVPITGQTLAVGLVGATLGLRRGMVSMSLYALLGLFLPFYADGESGLDVVWGASGGYIIGFIFAAGAIGWFAEHGADRSVALAFLAFVIGQLVIFAFGLLGLKLAIGESWSWTIHNGFAIFIVGGLVKAAIGATVLPSTWALVERFER